MFPLNNDDGTLIQINYRTFAPAKPNTNLYKNEESIVHCIAVAGL